MDSLVGFGLNKYEIAETNSDGLYEQVLLSSDWEKTGNFFTRYHVTIIN
jgi:hypothetical protein